MAITELKNEMIKWIGNLLGIVSDLAFAEYYHKRLTEK